MPSRSAQNLLLTRGNAQVLDVSQCDVLTVPCMSCNKKVFASNARHHRTLHRMLELLQYRVGSKPVSLLSLRLRRRSIIAKRMRSKKFSPLELQKIDFAYEMVKSSRLLTWPFLLESPIVCREEMPLPLRLPDTSCVKSLGIWQDRNAAWKSQMEDTYIFMDRYGGRSDAWFIGVFDGCHGASAAQFTCRELPVLILEQLATAGHPYTLSSNNRAHLRSYNPLFPRGSRDASSQFTSEEPKRKGSKQHLYSSIHVAFAKAFWKMDRILLLGRRERSRVRWSGCSVATCLLEPAVARSRSASNSESLSEQNVCEVGTLHIANAGDVHAVLCRNGKAYRLTENHSTSNRKECKRILLAGGTISKNEQHGLVEGFIQSTRGLGFHGDPKLKTSIVPIPHTASVPIDSSCQFLVLASSGFWKVLSRHEVVSISLEMLSFYLRSFHTESREIRSVVHSLHIMEPNAHVVDRSSTVALLLEEFSQQGHRDALMSLKRLFEEVLISKKHGWKIMKPLAKHLTLMKDRDSLWQAVQNLLQNIPTEEKIKSPIEKIIDVVSQEMEHDRGIFMKSVSKVTLNEKNSEDKTKADNFLEKPLPENEGKDNGTFIEHKEHLTKEKYNDSKLSMIPKAEVFSRTEGINGHLSQEDISKKLKKQKSAIWHCGQIEPTPSETFTIEKLYEEAYLMNQDEASEESDQETPDERQEIQYETLANTISKRLVEIAKQAGASDNVTVLILLLPGCNKLISKREELT